MWGRESLVSLSGRIKSRRVHVGDLAAPSAGGSLRSLPVFGGGGASTVAVSITLAVNARYPLEMTWAAIEIVLVAARLAMLSVPRKTIADDAPPADKWSSVLDVAGAASVGFGAAIAIGSGSLLGSSLGLLSAAAFAGETSIRHVARASLVAATICVACLPSIMVCVTSAQLGLQVAAVLLALFAARMAQLATGLRALIVNTQRAERDSDYQARHDRLTGLLNRAGLERELDLMRRDQPRSGFTLYFVDLDGFKQVNDRLGHDAGDRLLRAVAEQLLDLAATRDIVARLGGDEFILISSLGMVQPEEFAAAILAAVRKAREKLSIPIAVTASVGISHTLIDSSDLTDLMSAADVELYKAKRTGGDRWAKMSN